MQRLPDEPPEISNIGSYFRNLYTILAEKCNDLYTMQRKKHILFDFIEWKTVAMNVSKLKHQICKM
jgi:hypothetical protein